MLLNLHVKNLAIIDETEVDFTEGLNILSGETGAGKSIIIDSINMALGEKVPKEMLRENAEYALVELIFQVTDSRQIQLLENMDIYPENEQVIMSRRIAKGRSIGKINSESVSASKMREAAAVLIDIHGQHEHQSLLHKRKHLEILDDYAKEKLQKPKAELKKTYSEYAKLKEEWNSQNLDEEQRNRELSFLQYEWNEITEAALKPNEDEVLEAEYRRLVHGKKIMEGLTNAYEQTGGDVNGAAQQIDRALRELIAIADYDEKAAEMKQQLEDVDNILNDFNREISSYMNHADFDEHSFAEVEQRLDLINHLKSKYGDSIEKIQTAAEEKEAQIAKLIDYDAYLEKLRANLEAKRGEAEKFCAQISDIRQKYAKKLVKEVKESLVDLNFLDVKFEMFFQRTGDITANGYDDAEFLISTNPGEPVKPLGKIASGGELSRIMLAIKSVLAQNDKIETLIFDEIDSGISGRTAQAVSEKMNHIGKNHQVICITHLPQIAAMADSHFLIEKIVKNNVTTSNIMLLSREDSVKELARMLGGVKITDTVLQSAKEMKELALREK